MIAIVGAGITGLVLSHRLSATGTDHIVLEADHRPGGMIHTVQLGEHVLECGPQRTRLTAGVAQLLDDLDLRQELLLAPEDLPLYIYREGKLRRAPLGVRDMVTTDLLRWRGKARLLMEPFTAGEKPDETVASFVTRKLGREAYEYLVGPLYGGLYASDPRNMLMRLSLSRALRELGVSGSLVLTVLRRALRGSRIPPACSFQRGMATLPEALCRQHGERIHLATPARHIRRAGQTTGYEIVTSDTTYSVSAVVITTPADEAARLLENVAAQAADRLRRLTYNPLAVVHLFSENSLKGMGYQVPFSEDLVTRGVTWNSSLFNRPGIFTAYLGGARNPEAVRRDDEWLAATARREFQQVTGAPSETLHIARTRMPAWDRTWQALEGLRLPRNIHICSNYESRAGVPGRIEQARKLAARLASRGSL